MDNEHKRQRLLVTCPAGHQVSPAVTRDELAEAVLTNSFKYFCIFCRINHVAPPELMDGVKAMLTQWNREIADET
ncbi:MAG: hypothetical protein JO097_03685 [Acidobacteriaceae bacterium]|nr:hypothetical protein [Acidobacteriaceae bacterium]